MRQAFVEAPIWNHFDLEYYIRIEKNALSYAIGRVFSQLTSDDLGQWYQIAFFSKKMILAKTWYETYDGDLLAIVEVSKTWKYYLKGSKHKVLVFTDYNNLQRFMNIKNLSSKQVQWA